MQILILVPPVFIALKWFYTTEPTFILFTFHISEISPVPPRQTYAAFTFHEGRNLWWEIDPRTGPAVFSIPPFWKTYIAIYWLLTIWNSESDISFSPMCSYSLHYILECLFAGGVEIFPTLREAVRSNNAMKGAGSSWSWFISWRNLVIINVWHLHESFIMWVVLMIAVSLDSTRGFLLRRKSVGWQELSFRFCPSS